MNLSLDYSGNMLGKYCLLQKLGNGSFGSVYKALDTVLNEKKAIKILEVTDPKEALKLFNEASIPRKCRHNNIIKINGGELIETNCGLVFVVDMELVKGESVDSLLKHKYLSVIECLNIMKQILFAVEYSHLNGIIHRDIKPANILIDNGVSKLSDFGLSTTLGKVISPWTWYRTHAAPETFVNNSIATVQTDIFALGMTMYRMENSIPDWKLFLNNIPNAENLIKNGNLIDILPLRPFVPLRVHKIVKKACKKNPGERYSSASEMRNAIEKLIPLYNWKFVGTDHWQGFAQGHPQKEIYIYIDKSSYKVVVTNNCRKSSQDSKYFSNLFQAQQYMLNYIRETTLQ